VKTTGKSLLFPCFLACAVLAAPAWAQQGIDISTAEPVSIAEGWRGFTDIGFLLNAFLTLGLSAILGAAIGYHPRSVEIADTLLKLEAPKVYILCSVIGAIIGMLVVKYGLVVGFVIFGIGGLIRFRTVMGSASLTGNMIFVTLIGLSCGLNLPHVAVLSTVFGYVLNYVLHLRTTYSIDIKGIPAEKMLAAAAAYRGLLQGQGCRIAREEKKLNKEELQLIFQCSRSLTRQRLEQLLDSEIDPALKGTIDWECE
jgi:hypothetical protein